MLQQQTFKKTRIAPTPSGYLHMGNVFSFVVTAALAERSGAKILLRIDDLDRERVNTLYVQDIVDTLNFLEIPWHEGPKSAAEYEREFSQVHRMDMYNAALRQLEDSGNLFACTCSRKLVLRTNADGRYPGTCTHKAIPLDAKDVCWRMHTGQVQDLEVKTLKEGTVKAPFPANMNNFIVRRKDGFPGYQLTSLLDDLFYGVDLVVRGEDLWPSTIAQLHLSTKLQQSTFSDSTFHHHSLLLDDYGEKLSKTAGSISVQYLRREGNKPSDIFTGIAQKLGIEAPAKDWHELAALMELL